MGWGWVHTKGKSSQFELMVHPETGREGLEGCLAWVLDKISQGRRILCLVPGYHDYFGTVLTDLGFTPGIEYSCFVKQLTISIAEPSLVPARA